MADLREACFTHQPTLRVSKLRYASCTPYMRLAATPWPFCLCLSCALPPCYVAVFPACHNIIAAAQLLNLLLTDLLAVTAHFVLGSKLLGACNIYCWSASSSAQYFCAALRCAVLCCAGLCCAGLGCAGACLDRFGRRSRALV